MENHLEDIMCELHQIQRNMWKESDLARDIALKAYRKKDFKKWRKFNAISKAWIVACSSLDPLGDRVSHALGIPF